MDPLRLPFIHCRNLGFRMRALSWPPIPCFTWPCLGCKRVRILVNVSLRVCSRPQRTRLFSSELTTKRKFQHILDPTLSSACIFLQPWGSGPSIVFQSKSGESKLLTVDFRSPVLQPSVPWSRRKCEFDIWVRYSEMLRNRERLRLVAKKWKAIVETYPWRRLDL